MKLIKKPKKTLQVRLKSHQIELKALEIRLKTHQFQLKPPKLDLKTMEMRLIPPQIRMKCLEMRMKIPIMLMKGHQMRMKTHQMLMKGLKIRLKPSHIGFIISRGQPAPPGQCPHQCVTHAQNPANAHSGETLYTIPEPEKQNYFTLC